MKKALIVGGAQGIGLAIATELALRPEMEQVYIADKATVDEEYINPKFKIFKFDLTQGDYSLFDQFQDIDTLMFTAGWGHLALFRDLTEKDILTYFNVNTLPFMRIVKRFYSKLASQQDFYCGAMVSIAGFMSSPFFSVYAATKAALKVFIESVNVELLKGGSSNQILNVSPGSIKGTSFNQGATDLNITAPLAEEILRNMEEKNDLFIPQYEEVFKNVLERYYTDFRKEGLHSYEYKVASGRVK